MPTVLLYNGWRLFFYSNENNEPVHIHCQKADKECKFWIIENDYDVKLAFSFNMNSRDLNEVRKLIFNNFQYLIDKWNEFQSKKIK
jgi:hypothetical protein